MGRKVNLIWLRGVDRSYGKDQKRFMVGAAAVLILVGLAFLVEPFVPELKEIARDIRSEPLPDFRGIENVQERKQAFFDFLLPHITDLNEELLDKRGEIESWRERFREKGALGDRKLRKLNEYLLRYKFDEVEEPSDQVFMDLLSRVDIIPPSMALAQAAIESGWGASRFAREGNNLFGMWCYEPGCGMIPKRRALGATHEVAKYDSPRDSFEAYVHNLNTNRAYVPMRAIRRELRVAEKEIVGSDLARGLERYSTQRWEYVGKIQTMIAVNELESFDREE